MAELEAEVAELRRRLGMNSKPRRPLPLLEAVQVGSDGRDVGLHVVGVLDAEAGEDIQGALPMIARLITPVQ